MTGQPTPLRDRLADAIRRVVRISAGEGALADLNAGRSIPISGGEADDAALAVLPVVEAEVAARSAATGSNWQERAEQAERERDEARAAVQRVRDLHHDEDGSCSACMDAGESSAASPCATVTALDPQETQ